MSAPPIEDIRELCRDGYDASKYIAARQRVRAWLDGLSAKPEPSKVTPATGQTWQRLNNGNKTASSAPRLTVHRVIGVWVWVRLTINTAPAKMRISTLQRDWYCLNP